PGAVPDACGFHRPRSARVHRRRPGARRPSPPPAIHAGELFPVPGGNGEALRRSARGARQLRRDRAPLQSRARAGQTALAGFTDLDPLRYDLLFERFLNPERVSMPDFDIDFCERGRDRVIEYVKRKYGAESVSQIATFGTMAARAVVRDVGRVMEWSYTRTD